MRRKLRLVRPISETKKKLFNTLTVYCVDGTTYRFELDEWDAYRDGDWIEIEKKDHTAMHGFLIVNIIHVVFEIKNISIPNQPELKPVV